MIRKKLLFLFLLVVAVWGQAQASISIGSVSYSGSEQSYINLSATNIITSFTGNTIRDTCNPSDYWAAGVPTPNACYEYPNYTVSGASANLLYYTSTGTLKYTGSIPLTVSGTSGTAILTRANFPYKTTGDLTVYKLQIVVNYTAGYDTTSRYTGYYTISKTFASGTTLVNFNPSAMSVALSGTLP